MSRRIAVRGIIVDDSGKLFCVRHKAYGSMEERMFWCVPGGGLDAGEPLIDGVAREILEETGVDAKIGELLFVQQYGTKEKEELEFFFYVSNWENFVDINITSASHSEEEIAEFGFIDAKKTYILPKFLSEIDLRKLSSNKLPIEIFNYLQ
jgi:8-oxo-dGTP pyrophosphatase MutT (NUDIX family)